MTHQRAAIQTASLALVGLLIVAAAAAGYLAVSTSHRQEQETTTAQSQASTTASLFGNCSPTQGAHNGTVSIFPIGQPLVAYGGTGRVVWCIYDGSGVLKASYVTNRTLGAEAASIDGSSVTAVGLQILPGRAGAYANGAVYFFDEQGQMKWNITSSQPLFDLHANERNSVIIVNDPQLLYLNGAGKVLWNYSTFESMTAVLLNNGSAVVAGINQILFPGHLNFGSALTMFDSNGRALWNVSFPDYSFDCGDCLAYSNGILAAGLTVNGYNGTVSCYDLHGNLVWSRYADSAIIGVSFQSSGSAILAKTNWGGVTFDLAGNVKSNQTAPHSGP